MNLYASIDSVKTHLGISDSDDDALLASLLEMVSRGIDEYCDRHFFVKSDTRYYETGNNALQVSLFDDLLSVTTLTTDSEDDGTFDGETWAENTDFVLLPDNHWPKHVLWVPGYGNYSFDRNRKRYVKIVGEFGFGNGTSATPYTTQSETLTVADGTTAAITVSASGHSIEAGHTLLCESEQIYVSSVSGTTLTTTRGVNGTTGAAHSAAACSIYEYPGRVKEVATRLVSRLYNKRSDDGFKSRLIGSYQIVTDAENVTDDLMRGILGPFVVNWV